MQEPHHNRLVTARAALSDGRLAHARAVLRTILQDDPDHGESWALLSEALDAGPEQEVAKLRAIVLGALPPPPPIPPPRPRRTGRLLAVVLAGIAIGILLVIWLVMRPVPALEQIDMVRLDAWGMDIT